MSSIIGDLDLLFKVTEQFSVVFFKIELVTTITHEGFKVGFANLYQGCIPCRSQMSAISDFIRGRPCDPDNLRRL